MLNKLLQQTEEEFDEEFGSLDEENLKNKKNNIYLFDETDKQEIKQFINQAQTKAFQAGRQSMGEEIRKIVEVPEDDIVNVMELAVRNNILDKIIKLSQENK